MTVLTNKAEVMGAATDFHLPTSKYALIIFTRNPEIGRCKTRLAATIGDQKALEVYTFLLSHTVAITQNIAVDKYVFYADEIWNQDQWSSEVYRKKLQQGLDLGARMENAFAELFKNGHTSVLIIGSDMFELNQTEIEEAYLKLESHDFVIGPAADGGYYLLGMKYLNNKLFQNKNWSSASVLSATRADLKNESVFELAVKNDVDLYEDIKDIPIFHSFLKS